MKVDNSLWRCKIKTDGSITGECDEILIQQKMEEHLWTAHRLRYQSPLEVVDRFALIRTAEVPRGGVKPGTTADTTMPMFEKGIDFR